MPSGLLRYSYSGSRLWGFLKGLKWSKSSAPGLWEEREVNSRVFLYLPNSSRISITCRGITSTWVAKVSKELPCPASPPHLPIRHYEVCALGNPLKNPAGFAASCVVHNKYRASSGYRLPSSPPALASLSCRGTSCM